MTDPTERCSPCDGTTRPFTRAEAEAHLADLEGWTLDFPRLRRRVRCADFRAALALLNRIGMLAEEEGHHPDFHLTGYRELELVLTTHAIGGLSRNDFVLAEKIEALIGKRA